MLQNADLLVASTQIEHDNFRNHGLTRPIAILPVGIDVSEHDTAINVADSQDREKVVLFLSRLSEKKGIPDLLQAWHGMTDRHGHQLHIHGYGADDYRTLLEGRVRSLDLSDSVRILGPLFDEEKWEKYRTSSIYVLPSYSENFGITIAEALLSGLPAITTKATPWNEIVSIGIGWIVNNDAAQLRRALEQAISLDAGEIAQMRERASAYARTRFLWAPIIQQYVETYEWLLDPRRDMPSWVMRKGSRPLK
jgi:glycosyltransferase involved in cell wall biosynthesis